MPTQFNCGIEWLCIEGGGLLVEYGLLAGFHHNSLFAGFHPDLTIYKGYFYNGAVIAVDVKTGAQYFHCTIGEMHQERSACLSRYFKICFPIQGDFPVYTFERWRKVHPRRGVERYNGTVGKGYFIAFALWNYQ